MSPQDSTDVFFVKHEQRYPCYIFPPQAYDYVVENYSEIMVRIVEGFVTGLSATAIAEAEAAWDSFVEQLSCVRAVSFLLMICDFQL